MRMMHNRKIRYIFLYTIIFTILFIIGYSSFIFDNYTFIHHGDALSQHYPALIYFGQYLRGLPEALLSGNLPMYDFAIGMGDDIIATLMMHSANADVLHLLFAVFPESMSYIAYVMVIILRLYLSGLAFSYYCFTAFPKLRDNYKTVLLGALIYTFSGWTCYYQLVHPSFLIALLYLPLIMAGFDKVLRDEKPYLFIISVFLLGLASFYFLYMVTILVIFYAFVRIHHLRVNKPDTYSGKYIKNVVKYGILSSCYYLTGFAMSAVIVFPLLAAYFSSNRMSYITSGSLVFYSPADYLSFAASFPSPTSVGPAWAYARLGMSAVVPPALILLIFQKPLKKHLVAGMAIAFAIENIPLGAFVLNGFGYVTNRVELVFSFVYALVAVFALQGFEMNKTDRKKAAAAMAVYSAALLVSMFLAPQSNNETFFLRVGFAFVVLFIFLLILPPEKLSFRFLTQKRVASALYGIVLLNLLVNIITANSLESANYVRKISADMYEDYVDLNDYAKAGTSYRQGTPFTLRTVDYYKEDYVNAAMLFDYKGVSQYWSLGNPAYGDFSFEMENSDQSLLRWRVDGFDNRTALYQAASVKYLFAAPGTAPYGYDKIADVPFRGIYENRYALPLGYTYEKSISKEQFDNLHPLEKQEALMQAVAISEAAGLANTDISGLDFDVQRIPLAAYTENGLIWEDGILDSTRGTDVPQAISLMDNYAPGTLLLEFERGTVCDGNCETYIRLIGYDSAEGNNSAIAYMYADPGENGMRKEYFFTTKNLSQYMGREERLINLGYCGEPVKTVRLGFYKGRYTLSGIEAYCVPMDSYGSRARAMGEDVLENIVTGTNSVTGSISLDKDKFLVLSIPYSKGWRCTVNGEDIELLRANAAFMAIPLAPGDYSIGLTYITPGICAGAIISLTGFVAFAAIICVHSKKKEAAGKGQDACRRCAGG